MGLLKWMLLPISGPVTGTMWVAEQLVEEARRQHYDETAIRHDMLELERRYTAGEVAEEQFQEASDALLQRLLEARAWHQARDAHQES